MLSYSTHPQYSIAVDPWAPAGMIWILTASHLISMTFLILELQPRNIYEHSPGLNLFFISSVGCFVILFFLLRINYSFHFLGIFLPVVWTWVILVNYFKNLVSLPTRYVLAQFGEWGSVREIDQSIPAVFNPEDIRLDEVEKLIIDDHVALPAPWQRYLMTFRSKGIGVINISEFLESVHYRVSIIHCSSDHFAISPWGHFYRLIKRVIDIVISILAIIFFAPIFVACAILVRADSPGQIIYRQVRVGRKNNTFTLFKLRTMYSDSELDGPRFAQPDDPRMTSVGRWLRHFKLDEIPQFFNVLMGDMSLVGPRPERPFWAEEYEKEIPYYALRHIVRPGITGWAQVTHGYTSTVEGTRLKLERDLYYVKYQGLVLDVKILFRTLHLLFHRHTTM